MKERFKTFTLLMLHINRCIRKIKVEEMSAFCLKSQHVSCLYYLYRGGSLTVMELCEVCEEDKANISRSIDFLEENGYLVSTESAKRYRRHLTLSEKGMAVAKLLSERVDATLKQASVGISEEDRITMYRSLETISQNLQKICDQYEA